MNVANLAFHKQHTENRQMNNKEKMTDDAKRKYGGLLGNATFLERDYNGYDLKMSKPADQGGVLANDCSNQEWLRETIDKAELTRSYGGDRAAREFEARAAEIDGGMKSGRFKTKAGGGSCGSSIGGVQLRSGSEMVGMLPIALLCAVLAYGAMYFAKHGTGGGDSQANAHMSGDTR